VTEQPARHVQADVSEARIARLWGNIAERLEQRGPAPAVRRFGVVGGGLLAVAAAAAIWLLASRGASSSSVPSAFEQAAFETGRDTSRVAMADGSKIELASDTRIDVVESSKSSVKLALRRGRVTCDVTRNPARVFSIVTGDVSVRVVGTKFTVTSIPVGSGQRVEVEVERGVVEVKSERQASGTVRLAAGQSFRQDPPLAPAPGSEPAPARALPRDLASPAPASSVASARELLDEANALRRDGQLQKAAENYDSLLRHYPSDARAGLAAFELGRLRMDSLHDLTGAAQALERAVALAPGSGFREDAIARLVQVYDGLGRSSECDRMKDRYLSSYPRGVHRDAVATRCSAR
jgi:transmembrane sensor